MSDDELKAKWAKIDNLPDAVDQFMEHSMYVGTDPYYADMNDALWAMLERCRNLEKCKPSFDNIQNFEGHPPLPDTSAEASYPTADGEALAEAIAELQRAKAEDSVTIDTHDALDMVLNAVLSGALIPVQCCMCGKTGLSTAEDGGQGCELHDGRWVCSSECWDIAVSVIDRLLAPRPAEPAQVDVRARLAAARETFCMASPGSDEEFTSLLLGFDTAAAIINGPKT